MPPCRVSIVVPAWNEEHSIEECVRTIYGTLRSREMDFEIVVVDDGSRDQTLAAARKLEQEFPGAVRVEAHGTNQGLGAALRTGFLAAQGEYLTVCPADFLLTLEHWLPFESALGQADVLVGCRQRRAGYNLLMRFNSWLYPYLVSFLFGLRLRDVNWICVYRKNQLCQIDLTQRGIPMLTEMLVKLRDLGATFREVDCQQQARTRGTASASRLSVMWKTLTGLIGFWRQYRRSPRITTTDSAPSR
jgi:glycosyltransferase involved in cell wall biosynthesis